MKLFKVIKKHHDTIPDLMKDLKKEIKEETEQLKERTKEWSKHVKANNAEAHEQYLDRVEMDDDMEQLAKRKAFNLVKITQRLNRLHVERGRPCSGTRCETLRRVVGALRRAKKALSDADVCDAAKDCQTCTKMSFCGWCDKKLAWKATSCDQDLDQAVAVNLVAGYTKNRTQCARAWMAKHPSLR